MNAVLKVHPRAKAWRRKETNVHTMMSVNTVQSQIGWQVHWYRSGVDGFTPLADDLVSSHDTSQTQLLFLTGFVANRATLIAQNELPRDTSTERLLTILYQKHRRKAAQLIAGPLSWIVWDADQQCLVAASDRGGNHGLFYAETDGWVILSSSVELLLPHLPGRGKFNQRSLVALVNNKVPLSGETCYEAIRSIPPGNMLIATQESSTIHEYWRLEQQPELKLSSDAEYAEALREQLFQVVAEYVPASRMGVTVSSGMDSTSVAAALCNAAPAAEMIAFSWTTPDVKESDELPLASSVCDTLHLPMAPIRVDERSLYTQTDWIATLRHAPYVNIFQPAWRKTYGEARQRGIETLFSGLNGGILFNESAVSPYPDLLLSGQWLKAAQRILAHAPRSTLSFPGLIWRRLLHPILKAYTPWLRRPTPPVPWLGERNRELYTELYGQTEAAQWTLPGRREVLRILRFPRTAWDVQLLQATAAARGIEWRHPLLDHRLVEFAASLPIDQTLRATTPKFILRNAMAGYLPKPVLDLTQKIHVLSLSQRILGDYCQPIIWSLLTDMRAAELGLVDEKRLRMAYQDYLAGGEQRTRFIRALALEDWLRRYF